MNRFVALVGLLLPLSARAAVTPSIITLTRSTGSLTTSWSGTAGGLPGDHLQVTASADQGQIQLTLTDGTAAVTTPTGTLAAGGFVTLNNGDSVSLGFPTSGSYAFSASSIGGITATNTVGFAVQISSATTTSITSVMNEPSLPFESASVNVQVTGVAVQPKPGSTVEVRGDDGSYAKCTIVPGAAGGCSIAFDAVGTIQLTARFLGDGVLDPSSASASHTVAAPIVLSGSTTALVNAVFSVSASGLTPSGSVTVDFGDGTAPGPVTTDASGNATLMHTYPTEGLFVITVDDTAASRSGTRIVDVFTGTAPIVVAIGAGTEIPGAGVASGPAGISATLGNLGPRGTVAVGIYASDPTGAGVQAPANVYDVRADNPALGASLSVWFTYPVNVLSRSSCSSIRKPTSTSR